MSYEVLGQEGTLWESRHVPRCVTLLQLCNDVMRRIWTVVAVLVSAGIWAVLLTLERPRTYTSVAAFVGEARQPLSAEMHDGAALDRVPARAPRGVYSPAAGLHPGGSASLSLSSLAPPRALEPGFYEAMLRSRELLMSVAESHFEIPTPGGVRAGTAADLYGLPPGPPLIRAEDAARRLARGMTFSHDERTGVFTLKVRTFDAEFSRAIATRVLDAMMARNRRMAHSHAQAQVAFLTRATAEARQELRRTERRLARFLESNRAFVPASRLAAEYVRLDSDVRMQRRHHAELALQLEGAKLDRSRAIQLVTVIARPDVPSRPDARGTIRAGMAGAVGGGTLALLVVLTGAQLRRLRADGSADLSELESEWRTVRRRPPVGGIGAQTGASMAIGPGGGSS